MKDDKKKPNKKEPDKTPPRQWYRERWTDEELEKCIHRPFGKDWDPKTGPIGGNQRPRVILLTPLSAGDGKPMAVDPYIWEEIKRVTKASGYGWPMESKLTRGECSRLYAALRDAKYKLTDEAKQRVVDEVTRYIKSLSD